MLGYFRRVVMLFDDTWVARVVQSLFHTSILRHMLISRFVYNFCEITLLRAAWVVVCAIIANAHVAVSTAVDVFTRSVTASILASTRCGYTRTLLLRKTTRSRTTTDKRRDDARRHQPRFLQAQRMMLRLDDLSEDVILHRIQMF